MSDPEVELAERIDELSPHQRALAAVLRLWTKAAVPASILFAVLVSWSVALHGHAGAIMGIYLAVAVPGSLGAWFFQERARKAIARRVLAQLDAPARAAVSGRESPAGFLGVGDGRGMDSAADEESLDPRA